jgi:hypothetical protein
LNEKAGFFRLFFRGAPSMGAPLRIACRLFIEVLFHAIFVDIDSSSGHRVQV